MPEVIRLNVSNGARQSHLFIVGWLALVAEKIGCAVWGSKNLLQSERMTKNETCSRAVTYNCGNASMLIDLAGELTSSAEPALLNAYQQASSNGARLVILNFRQ